MKLRASTKQKVEIKEKLKLDRSANKEQAASYRQMLGSSTYYFTQKGRKKREKVQNQSCWHKTNLEADKRQMVGSSTYYYTQKERQNAKKFKINHVGRKHI